MRKKREEQIAILLTKINDKDQEAVLAFIEACIRAAPQQVPKLRLIVGGRKVA